MLAGAAGATVIGAALSPTTAHAADGGNVTLGADNAASSATRVTIGGGDRERHPDTGPEQRQRSIPRPGGATPGH